MAKPLVTALVAAVPIELVNSFIFTPPIDVGLPDNAGLFAQFMGGQWAILHSPGLFVTSKFDPYGHFHLLIPSLLLSGYLDTALPIVAGIYAYRGLRQLAIRVSGKTGDPS